MMARLDAHRFAHPHEHIAYADAGHGGVVPGALSANTSAFGNLGGTPAGNAATHADVLPRMLAFFARTIGVPRR